MKIANIETIAIDMPVSHGGEQPGQGGRDWKSLSTLFVKVETDTGIVGYGDAFCYECRPAVQAAIEHMIAPRVIGQDASNITRIMQNLQKDLHIFGRYGILMFAMSGLDLALWDIAGKAVGKPLSTLLGGVTHDKIAAYASLFRYRDPEIVSAKTREALSLGYKYIKLHERYVPEVKAARDAAGPDIPIMIDTNCPWTPDEARINALLLKPYDPYWLEEPIFPPEDYPALGRLKSETGVPTAAGENACTVYEFRAMFAANAVTYAQPSVTKVGGVTEFRKITTLAQMYGVTVIPHSPYFGPGLLATLHLMAAHPDASMIERYFINVEASLYGDLIHPVDGFFCIPDAPGIGPDPDPDVLRDYAVK
jgi:D-galactarolactone cycloisomerase